jgi:hypothetical protein
MSVVTVDLGEVRGVHRVLVGKTCGKETIGETKT